MAQRHQREEKILGLIKEARGLIGEIEVRLRESHDILLGMDDDDEDQPTRGGEGVQQQQRTV